MRHINELKVALLEGIHPSAKELLQRNGVKYIEILPKALEGAELEALLKDVHYLGIRSRTQLTDAVLNASTSLDGIGCFCIGTNQVDLEAAALLGVPVFNAPHANTRSVAELVIGLMVMLKRGIFEKSTATHRGEWLKSATGSNEVRGKTIGIVGYGHIGSQVSVLSESLGLRVVYYDILTKLPMGNATQLYDINELYAQSDIVTYHVPETEETKGMVNSTSLSAMKEGVVLINASRGTVIEIEALAEALRSGHVKGAAVDVFPKEPKKKDEPFESPLLGMDNVILTPHIGGSTEEAQEAIGVEVATRFLQYMTAGSTEGAVNFPQINVPPHKGAHRILHIHHNVPGILRQINRVVADEEINIQAQYLETKGQIGYVVLDIGECNPESLLPKFNEIDHTIRARILS